MSRLTMDESGTVRLVDDDGRIVRVEKLPVRRRIAPPGEAASWLIVFGVVALCYAPLVLFAWVMLWVVFP